MKTATVSMETVTFDTIDLALQPQRDREQAQTDIRKCNERLNMCKAERFPTLAREIRTCFIHIDFEALPSPDRGDLLKLPTTFALKPEQIKRLQKAASTLLDSSTDFNQLVRALRDEPNVGAGNAGLRGNCS